MEESGEYELGVLSTPPQELSDFFTCRTWGLPNGAGWLNEPVNFTTKISLAGNTYNAFKSMRASKNWANWAQENPDLNKLVIAVMQLLNNKKHD